MNNKLVKNNFITYSFVLKAFNDQAIFNSININCLKNYFIVKIV
jgi:hypothetical protein